MKTKLTPATKLVFKELKPPSAKRILKPLLSPLEYSIILHKGQPFKFKLNGAFVYVPAYTYKKFIQDLTQKIRMAQHLVQKDIQSAKIPFHLRVKFDVPAVVLSLHPQLRNRLCRLEL